MRILVSDNGRFTVLRFPGGQALPAIYAVAADGGEQLYLDGGVGDMVLASDHVADAEIGGYLGRVDSLAAQIMPVQDALA